MEIKVAYPLAHNQSCEPREECVSGSLPVVAFVEQAVRVTTSTTVRELRESVAKVLPAYHYVLAMTFEGKCLQDDAKLTTYGINREATVHADVRRDAFDIPTHGPPVFDEEE